MSTIKKLSWIALSVALMTTVLMVTACGGNEEETSTGPSGTPVGTPDTTGITDTSITFGTHFPLSGNPAAAFAPISYGMKAYFDYINAQGGVYGRKINLIIGDDQFNPANTVEVVRKLVEQDKVFGILSGLGAETHKAVYQYLEENGVPDLAISDGLKMWTNPVAHNRFTATVTYDSEGQVLGKYIFDHYPNAKVGILETNDSSGTEGEEGVRKGIEGSNVEIVAVEKYDVTQSDVSSQTQRLKASDADVLIGLAQPNQAASMVKTARGTLNWDIPMFVSGINCSEIFPALASPQYAEGVISTAFGPMVYDTENPGVQKYQKIWEKFQYGYSGPLNNFALYGMALAETTVYQLEMTGKDLSRQSFLDVAENMCKFLCSSCDRGYAPSTSPTDHRGSETIYVNQVQKDGTWKRIGDPVSFESTTECTPQTPPEGFDQQPKVGLDAPYVETP